LSGLQQAGGGHGNGQSASEADSDGDSDSDDVEFVAATTKQMRRESVHVISLDDD
jgi:hypothetical protein